MHTPDPTITVYIYYNAALPFAKLTLPDTDGYLYWLQDTLNLEPMGPDYCLRITSDRELRQLQRLFPGLGQCSRHLRYRAIIRRKATRAPKVNIVKTRQIFLSQPFEPGRLTSSVGFRVKWISSLLRACLSFAFVL